MIVLGIETSCDETSASIIKDGELLTNIVHTQKIHEEYGGVVPELASQEHLNQIMTVIQASLLKASLNLSSIDAIAVTYGPGLMGSLLIGLNFAKAMSLSLNIPFLGVNHLEGHLYSNYIDNDNVKFPHLCCLVSGGHTQLWKINDFNNYNMLGSSIDDAAGEAFDKGARILGLGYPGGPIIDKISQNSDFNFHNFPRPKVKNNPLNLSFSGLKTALLYYTKNKSENFINDNLGNIAASYQEAIIDSILDRVNLIIKNDSDIKQIYISGGVAANSRFRIKTKNFTKEVIFPALSYCTDNAAMIAMAGYHKLKVGDYSKLDLEPSPSLKL